MEPSHIAFLSQSMGLHSGVAVACAARPRMTQKNALVTVSVKGSDIEKVYLPNPRLSSLLSMDESIREGWAISISLEYASGFHGSVALSKDNQNAGISLRTGPKSIGLSSKLRRGIARWERSSQEQFCTWKATLRPRRGLQVLPIFSAEKHSFQPHHHHNKPVSFLCAFLPSVTYPFLEPCTLPQ